MVSPQGLGCICVRRRVIELHHGPPSPVLGSGMYLAPILSLVVTPDICRITLLTKSCFPVPPSRMRFRRRIDGTMP